MSNALMPKKNQDINQSIHVLANVFDQIDPINLKDSVNKINESATDIKNQSKLSDKDQNNHQNSKENYKLSSTHGNDTGNFAAHSSINNSKSNNLLNNSKGALHDSRQARPNDDFLNLVPRETFNPNDFEKLRLDRQSHHDDNQIVDKPALPEYPHVKGPSTGFQTKIPTEEEIAKMDKRDLERLMEERMDQIMAQQRQAMQPPARQHVTQYSVKSQGIDPMRHQTPFFRDNIQSQMNQQPQSSYLSNRQACESIPKYDQPEDNYSLGGATNQKSEQVAQNEEASFRSIENHSLKQLTPSQKEHLSTDIYQAPNHPSRASAPKENSVSMTSAQETEKKDREQMNEQLRVWQLQKHEQMQLRQNNYFDRNQVYQQQERPVSRQVRQQPLQDQQYVAHPQPDHSFSNNSPRIYDPLSNGQNQNVQQTPIEYPDQIYSEKQLKQPLTSGSSYNQTVNNSAPQHNNAQGHQPSLKAQQAASEFQAMRPLASQDPFTNQNGHLAPRDRQSSVGSRMSRVGRSQRYADGRQSRSGSRAAESSHHLDQDHPSTTNYANGSTSIVTDNESEISKVSIIKSPRQRQIQQQQQLFQQQSQQKFIQQQQMDQEAQKLRKIQQDRDASMELKRRRMQQDMAKAQEAQRQLDQIAKNKRQIEQQKLFQDIQSTKFGHQVLPQNRQRLQLSKQQTPEHTGGFGKPMHTQEQDADDFGDDEFNDIDEGTIRAGGPQNHRRNQQYQGPLNQRNIHAQITNEPDQHADNDTVDTRRQLHRGNNRGVKILQLSDNHENLNKSPQRVVNGRYGPKVVNAYDYQPPGLALNDKNVLKNLDDRSGSALMSRQADNQGNIDSWDSRTQQIMTPPNKLNGANQNTDPKKQHIEQLFNLVIQEKDPKYALNQFVMRDRETFEIYKDSIAEITHRIDRELSKVNKYQNGVADRLIEQRRVQDQNLQKYQDHLNQKRFEEQMKDCTFKPQVAGATNTVAGRKNSRSRHGSPAQFQLSAQEFIQRKQNWINQQNAIKDQEFQRMQSTNFVNDKSRKILLRRSSNTSGNTLTNKDSERPRSNTRGNSRASNQSNPRSDALNNVLNRSTDKKFGFFKRPDSGARAVSRGAISNHSKRSGSNSRGRIPSLAQYSGVDKRKLDQSKSPVRFQANPHMPSSEASDNYLTMQMHREFQDVIQNHIYEKGSLHIEDILLDMGFIDEQIISNQKSRLGIMLRQQRNNLLLFNSDGGILSQDSDEITQNLFKVLCSVMNFKQTVQIYQPIDENLLNSYLGYIDLQKEDQDILILEQLATIKSLINRQPFAISDHQVQSIHNKFLNLFQNRKYQISKSKKQAQENRTADQQHHVFQPQINYKSAQYKPQTNIYERSQLYHKLPDKDPRDIEYEQQQEHCTFKPITNKQAGRPWQGNRPPSRAGSAARGSDSRGRGRPDSRGSGTNNTSITRQRFGATVQTHPSTLRNNSAMKSPQNYNGNQMRKISPSSAIPRNHYVAQPQRPIDSEPFSEQSDASFKQNYLKQNFDLQSESSLSLNPQKFHEKQVKNSRKASINNPGVMAVQSEYTGTLEDPDTYICARETYKDEIGRGLNTPSHSYQDGKQTPTVTMAVAGNDHRDVKAQQSFAVTQSAMPSELIQQSSTAWPQRYEQEAMEQHETNSMVNDSFGPATTDLQHHPAQSSVAHKNTN